jgi:AraC-like DNA-binding protein
MKTFIYNNFKRYYGFPITIRNSEQSELVQPHTHDYIEIVMVAKGRAVHYVHLTDGTSIPNAIIKGDIFTILPGEIHSYNYCYDCVLYNICIKKELLDEYKEQLEQLMYFNTFFDMSRPLKINQLHLSPTEFKNAQRILHDLQACVTSFRPSRDFALRLKFLDFFLTIFDGDVKGIKTTSTSVDERLFQAIAKLEANPYQHFDIKQIALNNGMSTSSFAHKFKEVVGVPPGEYSLRLKLEKAKELLLKTNLALDEIALECSLYNGNYLIRVFKKRFGMTPGNFRKISSILAN